MRAILVLGVHASKEGVFSAEEVVGSKYGLWACELPGGLMDIFASAEFCS